MKCNVSIKILEHSTNVSINLNDQRNTVFPNPQYYALKKDRHLLATPDDINITLNSYSVLFQNLSRANSGNYSMTIQNYELGSSKEVGTFTSTFEVDVLCEFCQFNIIRGIFSFHYFILDGPEILPGMKKHYVLSGSPVSLICGYKLDSNPPANITWRDPRKKPVKASSVFILDDGPTVVRLNISNASNSDSGTWICSVDVSATCVHKSIEGKLKQDCQAITHIGSKSFDIELIVIGKYYS